MLIISFSVVTVITYSEQFYRNTLIHCAGILNNRFDFSNGKNRLSQVLTFIIINDIKIRNILGNSPFWRGRYERVNYLNISVLEYIFIKVDTAFIR